MRAARIPSKKPSDAPLGVFEREDMIGILLRKRLTKALFFVWSIDGVDFEQGKKPVVFFRKDGKKEDAAKMEKVFFSSPKRDEPEYGDYWLASYVRKGTHIHVVATSRNGYEWKATSETAIQGSAAIVSPIVANGAVSGGVAYAEDLFIRAYQSSNLTQWRPGRLLFTSRGNHFDKGELRLLGLVETDRGRLLLYDATYGEGGLWAVQAGGALFDKNNPVGIAWRGELPLWKGWIEAEKGREFVPLGAARLEDRLYIYWSVGNDDVVVSSVPVPFQRSHIEVPKEKLLLKKHHANPVLVPRSHYYWESEAVFNPAALYADGRVHLLYRAIGPQGLSVLGYAGSTDGLTFDDRPDTAAYFPREPFEGTRQSLTGPTSLSDIFASGGGWGGSEDPKLTQIGSTIYLTYVAYNGWSNPRVAISSISKKNFVEKNWKWSKPRVMSRPDVIDKSATLLPQKVNGKYVVFHRVYPDILIDFVEDLEFGEGMWLKNEHKISPRPGMWDSRKVSVGAPPIKTKDGWLVIYHAVDDREDDKYKIGAMILDLRDPTKVLYRTNHPILIPDMHYENDGKPGVAYPCGAVVIDETLYVYYGGGDRVVCVATADLKTFLREVKKDEAVELTPPRKFAF